MATEESRDTTSKALSQSSSNSKEVKLGRYRVVRRLGKGGMGEVYLGHDDSLNRQVAIKVMSRKLTDDPNFVARFKREAQAAASVSHANLVQIHELNETKGFQFFAMEYVQGKTLEELLEEHGHLPTAKVLDYICQAAKGLRAASKKGLIHRDIKPSNIMVDDDGLVKLTDFGLAKALQDDSNLTKTDVILGTPHYVSPEQARGEKTVDFRTDMYSLGVTLFEALTGQLPFDATTPMGVMLRHVNDPPPDILDFRPSLHEKVVALVNRLLAKAPADRFSSYEELINEIEAAKGAVLALGPQADEPPVKAPIKVIDEISSAETAASTPMIPTDSQASETVVESAKTVVSGELAVANGEKTQISAPVEKIDYSKMSFPPFGTRRDAFWGILRHPTATLQMLRGAGELRWWPAMKFGFITWLIFSVLTGIVFKGAAGRGLQAFFNVELLFVVPFLAFWTPIDHPHGRWKSAFYTVVLGWSVSGYVVFPLLQLLLLLYPIYMFKAMTHYLGIEGSRRYLFAIGLFFFMIMRILVGIVVATGG